MGNLRIDESTRLYGKVKLGKGVYIAQGSVIRAEAGSIEIGNESWVLENSVIIGSEEGKMKVGSKTIFGHKCIAIDSHIGDLCEIGNNTIFLAGSKVGNMCIFGEGTIVTSDMEIEDESVVVGRPGKVIRKLTKEDKEMIARMRAGNIELSSFTENLIDNKREGEEMGKLYEFNGKIPQIGKDSIVYDSAEIMGDVIIGENTIIAAGVRIVGNSHGPIRIGNNVQILENSVLHLLPDNELIIKDNVTIGPGSMIHGTSIGENTVIESGAIVCDYSILGENCLVKSGSLVKQRSIFGDNKLIEGFPGKEIGENEVVERPKWAIRE